VTDAKALGLAFLQSFWGNRIEQGFDPDSGYTVDVDNCIGEGDEAAIEYRAQGRNRQGVLYANNYLVRFTSKNGKILSIRPYFDTHLVSKLLFDLDRRCTPF